MSSARQVGSATAQFVSDVQLLRPPSQSRSARAATTRGEIDDFAVFCPELRAVYLIPIEDVPTRSLAALRVDPPRNGQTKKIRLAAVYEFARIDVY